MNLWIIAVITLTVGFVPGLLLFPWLASPVGPGLWKLSTPFTRIFLTVSQFIRKKGVLVKTSDGYYEIGTFVDEDGEARALLSDRTVPLDFEELSWGLFGKRPFGVTWEPGTELHQRISVDDPAQADGGGYAVNVGALHRYLRGANDESAITRTEEKAKAEFGLGDNQLSDLTMGILVGTMLLLGSLTTWMML
jgi:hypothetical protein